MLREISATARKEFAGFFSSPAAYIFLGGFLAATLFITFWVETFFARNIADLRPMFKWMPVLMIFLAGALTMRAWAEERRAGTLETLLTTPARPLSLVLGKFLAVEALVAVALVLTLPLTVSVSTMGNLDWGPVVGGYVATLFLAAAYVAIGLFVSAQTDNPIIALIVTVLVCAVFFFIGSDLLTSLAGRDFAAILAAIGSGTRFDSITRGVLDLRDLYYYISIAGAFLALNAYQLHRLKWAGNPTGSRHALFSGVAALAVANLLIANVWLAPVAQARADLTQGGRYTLSEATATALSGLEEPLLIRGYFSTQTHPLLSPLVPQLRDLLTEYAVAGGEEVRVEFVNPTENPDAEESAAEFGIRPTPFQTASRYSSSVVSSYFDVLVSYGDEYETLGFRDLIEIKGRSAEDIDVGLANPEYAITSAIRKVTQAYRSGGDPFSAIAGGVAFKGYVSPAEALPESLRPVRADLVAALEEIAADNPDSFSYSLEDPEADGGALAGQLQEEFGLGPQLAGLFDPQPFWFSLRLEGDGRNVPVTLPETGELDSAAFREAIEAAAKRLAPGFLRTIALATPSPQAAANPMMGPAGPSYSQLRQRLGENARVVSADLSTGRVPQGTDVLMVLAPDALDEKARFAIDQFLMRGGSVVLATSPYQVDMTRTLSAASHESGLSEWLTGYGIEIGENMVLDPQSAALPVPTERTVAGIPLREVRMVPYPFFPDVREDGLAQDHPVTAAMSQLTLNWASPITIDEEAAGDLSIARLIQSSPRSWTVENPDVMPDYRAHPDTGFAPGEESERHTLAVAATGRFTSAFAGQDSPLVSAPEDTGDQDGAEEPAANAEGADTDAESEPAAPEFGGVIESSPPGAKLVVVSASGFASDLMLDLASQGAGTTYTRPVEFLQNVADWATEDPALLALRGETQFANMLAPMSDTQRTMWEYLNYGFAALGLLLVWGLRRIARSRGRARYDRILNEVTA
ncbi:Gldg family protein [Paracoccus binzhouensis]|uniref:Gldg family protein n=1 Tax=Paracoccus binzhouensis TaxID=2796149 RepID=UPI0018EED0BA|nr:Gldg family protein [Paracoccus binzhouensis]